MANDNKENVRAELHKTIWHAASALIDALDALDDARPLIRLLVAPCTS